MTVWHGRVYVGGDTFSRRRAGMLDLVDQVRALEERAAEASSESDERFARRGQLTPRERLAHLLDPGAPWLELGNLHGCRRDVDDRDATVPGAGQLAGIGFVSGTRCAVLVTDAGIAAGAISHAGGEKIMRMQQVALDNRLPFLHLVESAGANLLTYRVEQFVEGWPGVRQPRTAVGRRHPGDHRAPRFLDCRRCLHAGPVRRRHRGA